MNSYSFIYSSRPGTTASNYKEVDEKLSKERLKILQDRLFLNQKLGARIIAKLYF